MKMQAGFRAPQSRFGRVGLRQGALTLASFFGASVTGPALDATALAAAYQDQAGTLADDPGETVGLLLDQSKGAVLGAERVTNFNFDSASGWTAAGGVAATTISGGAATLSIDTQQYAITNIGSVAAGTWLEVVVEALNNGSGGQLQIGLAVDNWLNSAASLVPSQNLSAVATTYRFLVMNPTAARSFLYLKEQSGVSTRSIVINSISVRELPGSHARQSNALLRPQVVVNSGFRHLRFDGADDALVVNLAAPQTGTMILAGRNGCWVETITRPAGDMTLGPLTVAGSADPNLLADVGDFVGLLYPSRVLSEAEIAQAVAYYRARGAGARL